MSDVERLFAEYKHKKIALYGLGTETEKVLREVKNGCEIVGLLDGFRENGTLYGLPILPVKRAIGLGIALIIVVARPASCRAIVKRIGSFAERIRWLYLISGETIYFRKQKKLMISGILRE